MSKFEMQDLLNAGAHFGHQTHKWNPKMKKYVFGERNGIFIIDLDQTIPLAEKAYDFLRKTAQSGKSVLFVGTKRQASSVIKETAESCGAYYVAYRWLGGMLTNFKTISQSIDKLRKVEKMKETGDFNLLTKKEQSRIQKEIDKLEKNLGGIKNMRKLPGAIFIIDPSTEHIAIQEAKNLGIPVVAITDTNCDPSDIDYVVPGNDDALKSITMFTKYFGNAITEGSSKAKRKSDDAPAKDEALEKEMLTRHKSKILSEVEGDDSDVL